MASTKAAGPLYCDSSSLLTWLLAQPGHEQVKLVAEAWVARRGELVSSRLLALEVRRTIVRERLVGNDITAAAETMVAGVMQIPVTELIWDRAAQIEQHIRTLDAIHLATCELSEAVLLTAGLDARIHDIAKARGVPML